MALAKNVPNELTQGVRFYGPHWVRPGSRELLYFFAAYSVIHHYVQRNLAAEALAGAPFLEAHSIGTKIYHGFTLRILMTGETLFLLRNCRGFPEICRRLKSRNLKASFFEMIAAKPFLRAGFDIEAKPETTIKGEDFDFFAVRGAQRINVEVTALEQKIFSTATAMNALQSKRRQLPKTQPAVIFCILPEEWVRFGINLNVWAATTAKRFLRTTSRVNALVLGMEHHRLDEGPPRTGSLALILKRFTNTNPHHPCNLSFLDYEVPFARQVLHFGRTRNSEFYRWVDALVA